MKSCSVCSGLSKLMFLVNARLNRKATPHRTHMMLNGCYVIPETLLETLPETLLETLLETLELNGGG